MGNKAAARYSPLSAGDMRAVPAIGATGAGGCGAMVSKRADVRVPL
jgi:hypothetical protein